MRPWAGAIQATQDGYAAEVPCSAMWCSAVRDASALIHVSAASHKDSMRQPSRRVEHPGDLAGQAVWQCASNGAEVLSDRWGHTW